MNRARSPRATAAALGPVLLALALCSSAAHACPEPAASGVQPCDGALRTALTNASSGMLGAAGAPIRDISIGQGTARRLISGRVPCVLVSAVAATESNWRHFNAACGSRGSTIVSFDCGYGIMQITSGMDGSGGFSPSRVAAEPVYNISVGVNILIQKWLAAGVITPNDPNIAEDWYLALWGYNGFASINNPNQHPDTRGSYFNPTAPAFPRNHYPYQEIVYGYALYPPNGNDGMRRWPSVRITHPNFSEICASCGFEGGPLSAISPTHSGACASTTPDWAGTYVSQSFPAAAAGAITMRTNQDVPAYIEMRNTGGRAWDARTFLATTMPRDRASPFVATGWTSPGRIAAAGAVAPGAVHRFNFTLHAPSTPGTFNEHFGMVEEGVTWFSDPSQGGPPDNLLEARIIVVRPDWGGAFVTQSFPPASATAVLTMRAGESLPAYIEMRNIGGNAWNDRTFLATTAPRDRASVFVAPDWASASRVAAAGAVAPNGVHRFDFTLHAPATPGLYDEYFGMVQESVAWFSDRAQAGPPDNLLLARIRVIEAADAGTSMPDAGATDSGTRDARVDARGDARADATRDARDGGPTGPLSGGCGCEIPGAPASRRAIAMGWISLAAIASSALRRRRRHLH